MIVCSAETPSIGDGELWSTTTATFLGSKTFSTPIRSSALIASGDVPSWPITKSTSAMTMSPACASMPACAEKIFSAMVLPAMSLTLPSIACPAACPRRPRTYSHEQGPGLPGPVAVVPAVPLADPHLAGLLVAGLLQHEVLVDVQQLLVEQGALEFDGHRAHPREQLVGLLVREVKAVLVELEHDGLGPGVLPDDDLTDEPHLVGREGLVGLRVLDDAVGVDAALVGEHACADDRLPHRDGPARRGGDVLAQLAEALRVHRDLEALDVLQCHDDLFERRIARALSQAADGGVDPRGAGVDAGDGVGHRHAEVVVGVHLDLHAGGLAQLPDDPVSYTHLTL